MLHQIVEVVTLALFTLATVYFHKRLPISEDYGLLVAGGIALVGVALLYAAFWVVRNSRWVRRHTDDLQIFEGDWLEEWSDGDSPRYSIASISYDKKNKTYRLDGNTYDINGKRTARWGGEHLFYDSNERRLVHVWTGERNRNRTHGVTIVNTANSNTWSGDGLS